MAKKKAEENIVAESQVAPANQQEAKESHAELNKAQEAVAPDAPQNESVGPAAESVIQAAKDAVSEGFALPEFSISPEVRAQLLKLAKGTGVASADAALVYLGDNLATVNFGKWKPLVVTLSAVLVREVRNVLHGGNVSDGFRPEALDVQLPEKQEESQKKE